MSFPNPFSADFWVLPPPPDNVVYLNPACARANAAQAALSLEEDRENTRRDEITAQLEELYAERGRVNVRIFDLENERDGFSIEESTHV
jgi:hypothetical protein